MLRHMGGWSDIVRRSHLSSCATLTHLTVLYRVLFGMEICAYRPRTVEPTAKAHSEARKLDADTRLVELEVRIKELELERARDCSARRSLSTTPWKAFGDIMYAVPATKAVRSTQ